MSRLGLFLAILAGSLAGSASSALAQSAPTARDSRCERSCQTDGACTWGGARCVAASSADCQQSTICELDGRCTAVAGECVLTSSADCALRQACVGAGECTLADGRCVASSDAECQQSGLCRESGECTLSEGQCRRMSSADCARAHACQEEGRCSFVDGQCTAATDADCQRTAGCTRDGQCTARDGACVIATAADCNHAGLCRSLGRCAPTDDEGTMECAATSDAMCRRSEACTRYGHCAAREGRCVPTSDAMCRRGRACREEGSCSLLEAGGISYCGPANDAACARVSRCRGSSCARQQILDLGLMMVSNERGYMCNLPASDPREATLRTLQGGLSGMPPGIPRLYALRRAPTGGVLGVLGSMQGTTIGESFGMGGLGLVGTGRGGGGTGTGTIGLGTLGTIGRGGGSGSGYGRGMGGLGGLRARPLRMGALTSSGTLPSEIYRRVVRVHMTELEQCATQSPPRDLQRVTLRFVVDRRGHVRRRSVEGSIPAALRGCLVRRAGQWTFPAGPDDSRIEVPLIVSPRAAP